MRDFKFSDKLIKLVDISIIDKFFKVKVGSIQTEPISVKLGGFNVTGFI